MVIISLIVFQALWAFFAALEMVRTKTENCNVQKLKNVTYKTNECTHPSLAEGVCNITIQDSFRIFCLTRFLVSPIGVVLCGVV